jgi:hypothetical protein
MSEYLTSKVAESRTRVADLRNQLIAAEAELRAYEDALAHSSAATSIKHKINDHTAPSIERPATIPSEMTPGWRKVLCRVSENGKSFDAADITEAASLEGVPAKMTNARSQIYQWQNKHLIQRVRKGKYRVTAAGQEVVKKAEAPGADAPEPQRESL